MSARAAVGFALALTLTGTTSHSLSAQAQGTGIREVSASSRSVIPLQTRLRYTTMVVLPDSEEILDVICGDKDFWSSARRTTSRTSSRRRRALPPT